MSKATGPNPEEREYPMPAQGHALPQDQWDRVVADAERVRAESDESETD